MYNENLNEDLKALAVKLTERDDMKQRKVFIKDILTTKSSTPLVRIYLDKEGGVNVSDLEYFHRELEILIDAEEIIKSNYILEISSPGIDKK